MNLIIQKDLVLFKGNDLKKKCDKITHNNVNNKTCNSVNHVVNNVLFFSFHYISNKKEKCAFEKQVVIHNNNNKQFKKAIL